MMTRADSKWAAMATSLFSSLAFLAVDGGVGRLFRFLVESHFPSDPRSRTTTLLTGACLGEWCAVLFLILYLRSRGERLRDLGFRRPASVSGWIAAAVAAAVFSGMMLAFPLRGITMLSELSAFRFYNALAVGITAGFCEEIVFRGFIMTALKRAGFGGAVQLIASGVLFGLAHFSFGAPGGHFNLARSFGATVPTAIIGMCDAGIYLLSRRSLMPVIASHAVTDMIIEPWLYLAALSGHLG